MKQTSWKFFWLRKKWDNFFFLTNYLLVYILCPFVCVWVCIFVLFVCLKTKRLPKRHDDEAKKESFFWLSMNKGPQKCREEKSWIGILCIEWESLDSVWWLPIHYMKTFHAVVFLKITFIFYNPTSKILIRLSVSI